MTRLLRIWLRHPDEVLYFTIISGLFFLITLFFAVVTPDPPDCDHVTATVIATGVASNGQAVTLTTLRVVPATSAERAACLARRKGTP